MPRNDGIRYGDVVTKKAKTKHMLEEQIRDIAPIEFEEETNEKI